MSIVFQAAVEACETGTQWPARHHPAWCDNEVALFDVLLAVEEVDGADGRLDVAGQLLQLPAGEIINTSYVIYIYK